MLTAQENDRFTQVGPGTPMGELMRRYWHPIAPSGELSTDNPTKEVRLLGEDLVLFRSAAGRLGLVEPSCPHRKANLAYGIPEPEGLRCAYHGWLYDEEGRCIDQPSEPIGSKFKEKVRLKAYKVQELGGLIFAYMGSEPAPILPKWDILVWDNVKRDISYTMLPCNWLQCMDNSLDPVHFEWLHNYWGTWVMTRGKPKEEAEAWRESMRAPGARGRHELKVGFDRFEYGIVKRRLLAGDTEDNEWWRIGHPIVFPNILRVGQGRRHGFQCRVPVDDTHTLHIIYNVVLPEPGETVPQQEPAPWREEPLYDSKGRLRNDFVVGQDQTAWVIQGAITDRTTEALGKTDVGIIMYRKILEEQMRVVEDGGDPMNVHRDDKGVIYLPQEHSYYPGYSETGGPFRNQPNRKPDVETVLAEEVNVAL